MITLALLHAEFTNDVGCCFAVFFISRRWHASYRSSTATQIKQVHFWLRDSGFASNRSLPSLHQKCVFLELCVSHRFVQQPLAKTECWLTAKHWYLYPVTIRHYLVSRQRVWEPNNCWKISNSLNWACNPLCIALSAETPWEITMAWLLAAEFTAPSLKLQRHALLVEKFRKSEAHEAKCIRWLCLWWISHSSPVLWHLSPKSIHFKRKGESMPETNWLPNCTD